MKRLLPSAAAAALISAAAVSLIPGEAAAADLVAAPPVVVEPLPVAHDWTGPYFGLHGGYGWGNVEGDDDDFNGDGDVDLFDGNDLSGGLFGAQLGYNYQWNWLVLGVEGDATWSFIDSDDDDLFDDDDDDFDRIGLDADVDWLASIRARAGAAFDRFFVYGTGGVAFTAFSHDFDVDEDFFDDEDDDDSETEVGWVLGLGAEYLVTDNVSVGAEYLHYEFNDVAELSFADHGGDIDGDVDVIRARVNVKFNSLFGG
jgi:outer membrane immunogenic protein